MASWYSKNTYKQLQTLLETQPSLQQLLAAPEFTQQLKTYNPKLLDYITNHPAIISEAITYLTQPPTPNDTSERKHKLPLQTIQLIQTETTCILNGFFKQGSSKTGMNFDLLFTMLDQTEILPVLAGYFFRANLCLLNNRYQQAVDRVYANPSIFHKLIVHSDHMAISNTIQLFLNLDTNKITASQEKLLIKKDVIKAIMRKIMEESRMNGVNSPSIIQNLCGVLIQTIDKYYLIIDGKAMIDIISDFQSIKIMMELIRRNNENSFPALAYFISLINYYSFSSHNTEENNQELAKKVTERLENQPMINEMVSFFPTAIQRILGAPQINLYYYRLLEVLCHCISIASMRIFKTICECRFFSSLIDLLLKHSNNNILHMLIQKSFYHVFISERKIYEQYKKHLFCDVDIIGITVSRVLGMLPEQRFFEEIRKKGYFGHFMRILKIYSGIQPTDQQIINAIKAKTNIWNKISQILIKPYESICFKDLGSYEHVPTPTYQEFIVKETSGPKVPQDPSAIQEINLEEHFPISTSISGSGSSIHSEKEETGSHRSLFDSEPANLNMKIDNIPRLTQEPKPQEKISATTVSEPKSSYKEFLSKKSEQVGKEIQLRRSLSAEKKLSRSGSGRMISPSPKKTDKWTSGKEDNKAESRHKQMIPPSRHHVGPQSNLQVKGQHEGRRGKSLNMEEIKKIKVIQIDPPKQKKYRNIQEKDRMFLQFLGINV